MGEVIKDGIGIALVKLEKLEHTFHVPNVMFYSVMTNEEEPKEQSFHFFNNGFPRVGAYAQAGSCLRNGEVRCLLCMDTLKTEEYVQCRDNLRSTCI